MVATPTPPTEPTTPTTPEPEFPPLVNHMLASVDATSTVREKVARLLGSSGLRPTDPFYRVLAALGLLSYLVEEAPDEIDRRVRAIYQAINDDRAKIVADMKAQLMQETISLLPEVVRQAGAGSIGRLLGLGALPVAATCLTLAGVVGAGLGHVFTRYHNPVAPESPVVLTVPEVEALQWARSPAGQQARNLQDWNPTLATRECEAEARNSGIVISRRDGKTLVGGFCVIYTQPPSARRYR